MGGYSSRERKVNRAVTWRHTLRLSHPVQSTIANFRWHACTVLGSYNRDLQRKVRHHKMKSTPTVRRVNSDLIGRSFISLGIQKRGPGDNATTRSVKKGSYYHRDVYRSTESNYSATYDSLEKAGAELCRYAR
jgi:hypothetical protein